MKTTLSIEESARLIELGVDPKLASEIEYRPQKCGYGRLKYRVYSFADLLSILPKSYFSEEYYDTMNLSIEVLNGKWFANYRYYCGGELVAQDVEKEAPELIDALYQLLIWCLEQGYLKTEKK